MEEGYLQNKIREQNEKLVNLENEMKKIRIEMDIHNKQIEKEKILFHTAFETLDINKKIKNIFKNRLDEIIIPIMVANKKALDSNIKNTLFQVSINSAKLNLSVQVLAALIKTIIIDEKQFILFENNLKNLDIKLALELFKGCNEEAKKLMVEFERMDKEVEDMEHQGYKKIYE
jgi:hypothetical protein